MTQIKKIKSYIKTLNLKLNSDDKVYKDLIKIKNLIIEAKKNNAKIFVFWKWRKRSYRKSRQC